MTDFEIKILKLKFGISRKKIFFIRIGKKLPASDRNALLQFINKIKAPPIRTFEFTHILFKSISDDISNATNWRDKDLLYYKEDLLITVLK